MWCVWCVWWLCCVWYLWYVMRVMCVVCVICVICDLCDVCGVYDVCHVCDMWCVWWLLYNNCAVVFHLDVLAVRVYVCTCVLYFVWSSSWCSNIKLCETCSKLVFCVVVTVLCDAFESWFVFTSVSWMLSGICCVVCVSKTVVCVRAAVLAARFVYCTFCVVTGLVLCCSYNLLWFMSSSLCALREIIHDLCSSLLKLHCYLSALCCMNCIVLCIYCHLFWHVS